MIKAIIFDLGGVLIDNPSSKMMKYCAEHLRVPEEEFREVRKKFESDFQKGNISEEMFWEKVCPELGITKPTEHSLWGDAFKHAYSEKREVFSIAYSLSKNGYKIGLLSNAEIPVMNYFYERWYKIFDVAVFSCTKGIRKPEREIYEIILKKLKVRPSETIFIDDRKDFIKGAERVGINTILFTNSAKLKREINLLLREK